MPSSDLSIDDGVGFLMENRSYTIQPEEVHPLHLVSSIDYVILDFGFYHLICKLKFLKDFMNATLPSFTIDEGKGFLAEDHANITNEEELANVTLKADMETDTSSSFRDEKHDGIEDNEVGQIYAPSSSQWGTRTADRHRGLISDFCPMYCMKSSCII